ncbi:hypothetical protein [Bythopirellula polymerisocia]|uniref:Uncharacterized protein n=1 Tax=Bythopirellula polymerisocia TaxID=2528003 RepID=A0A5C6CXH9_9BACT|nr:hypothetical protein [Bythopirellula polymerisocia]TWU28585.1 hypothetical protein Pla144_18760 [Bythopirellula polymerisocia]
MAMIEPVVDIAFDCLPLRSISRLDAPLDAPPEFRRRHELLAAAMERFGPARTYFLYNARCVFRLANSEIEGMIRFEFDGIVRTDASDLLTEQVDLESKLASDTCGGIPPEVEDWLKNRVEQAVAIEFDRFIAAGQLTERSSDLGQDVSLSTLAGFSGMNV